LSLAIHIGSPDGLRGPPMTGEAGDGDVRFL
jgi:hypothetical protein